MKVAFANGCFDILHIGHVHLLRQGRLISDKLVVGINSDESVRKLKGPRRPIFPATERMALLLSLRYVDEVVIFEEDNPYEIIKRIKPNILVRGSDSGLRPIGHDLVEFVYLVDMVPNRSTTSILRGGRL